MKLRLPIALAAASATLASIAAGCGGLLIITEPDGGPPPCCDGGIPDSGSGENGPPARSTTTLVALPDTTVVADGATAVTLRVVVRDAAGHLLSGVGVSMSCDGTGNGFVPTSASGYTSADGSFQADLSSTRAEPKTVTVAVADFTLTQALTFIAGRPDPVTSSLVLAPTPPSTVTADGVQTAAIAATLRDAHGNIVAGNTVTFTATGSNNTFNPGSQVVATDASGVARITLASTRAEPKTVVATVGSLFVMTRQVAFAPGSASAVTSTLTANPTQLVADGVARTSLTATVRDPNGNPIPGMSAAFSATGSGNRFTPGSTATTSVDGVARVQLDSTVAETKTVTAVVAGLTLRTAVLFGVGSPTNGNSSISVQTPVVADGTASGLITVTVRDGSNNPISGAAVALTATGSVNTFSPAASGSTNGSGVFQARLSSTAAETKSVTADVQSGTFFLTTSMDFLPGPASAANSRLDASPPQVPADGVTTTTLTVSMEDVNGNKVPGLAVTLSSTGSANTFSRTTGTTDSTGAFTATLKSTRAELKTVTATGGGVSVQTTVAFSPGPAVLANSSVTANPTNPVAGGFTGSTMTATLKDALGNPVPGVTVAFTASGSNNFFDPIPPTGVTGSAGTFSVRLNSITAETKTVTATTATIAPTGTVTFTAGAPDAFQSSMSATPSTVRADGVAYSTVTITVRDGNGNLVPGAAVSYATFNSADTWAPSSAGTTNASGQLSARLSSTAAGARTVYGTAGSAQVSTSVQFTP